MDKIKSTEVLVSVSMTTYNQEKYIAKAIESVVAQACNFRFELVIGEDCSTDNTREIVKKYAEQYPEIIRLVLGDKNVGSRQNARNVRAVCQGKYLAYCEGDDYWMSPNKLQKQIDLIESDDTFKAVYSQVKWVDTDDNELGFSDNTAGTLDFKQLLQVNPVHTCNLLIDRSVYTDSIMEILDRAPYGDYVIFLAAAFYGKIAYIDEVLAAYRRDVGIMSKWTPVESGLKRLKIFDLFEKAQTEQEYTQIRHHMKDGRYAAFSHFQDKLREAMKYFV